MPYLQERMREVSFILAFMVAISALSFIGHPEKRGASDREQAGIRGPKYLPGEVVVKFKSNAQIQLGKTGGVTLATGITSLDRLIEKFKGEELKAIFPGHERPIRPDQVDLTRFYRFRYRDGSDPKKVARLLQSTGAIEYAEPRYLRYVNFIPNDLEYGRQWYVRKIQADKAWDVTTGDTSVVIGIVDTGIDWRHPDLRQNIWHNPHPGQNPDFPSDSIGWDFGGVDGTPDNNPDEDRPDHGTHLAGLAAAVTDNGVGVAGIAFNCKLMAVKVSQNNGRDENGNPLLFYWPEGMRYAVDNGASIINASFGGPGYSQFEQEVINYVTQKGALVVAAAGNSAGSEPYYPAAYAHVLAVAATDSLDHRSIWFSASSSFGTYVDVSSPGSVIYSTWKDPLYRYLDGTSMSAPVVSGVAALVKSLHRNWTPDQIAEQIRVTSDPIDNINPGFEKQLGFGRVNAFRAVSDTSSPGVQMVSFTINDSAGGNNDASIDPGEMINLVGEFKNFLRPTTSFTAKLTTSDPFVSITTATVSLGAIGTLQTVTNTQSPFVLQVSLSAPENHKAYLYVDFSDGTYRDYTGFTLIVNATYKDHNVNNITMTVTSKGSLGFNDYPDNLQGTGFVFHRGGEDNLLFEGAFMAGTDVAHVVDAARSEDQSVQSKDFTSVRRFSFLNPSVLSNQDGVTVFIDSAASTNQIGLRVNLNTYAFKNPPDDDYILLKYTLVNRKAPPVTNLRVGLYFDWDVGSIYNNVAMYDSLRRLGYVFDTDPSGSKTYVGVALLSSGIPQFRAIDNDDATPGNPWGVYDGFTKAEKWEALSGGTTHAQEGPGDISMVIGTGPLSIGVGDSVVIGFAVLAGTSLSDLQLSADTARQKWGVITTDVQRISSQVPTTFFLYQNYPNPFNPATKIRYDLPHAGKVTIAVYNLLGQEVVRLVDTHQSAGRYEIPFEATAFSSGVYFYTIQAGSFSDTRKMVILK